MSKKDLFRSHSIKAWIISSFSLQFGHKSVRDNPYLKRLLLIGIKLYNNFILNSRSLCSLICTRLLLNTFDQSTSMFNLFSQYTQHVLVNKFREGSSLYKNLLLNSLIDFNLFEISSRWDSFPMIVWETHRGKEFPGCHPFRPMIAAA